MRAGLAANTSVSIDDEGKIHVASVKAIDEPPSLIDLRRRVEAMMPRVDISEAVVEVLGWCPKFMEAFTSIAGTGPHPDNLDISVAACLTAQALNITYGPIAVKGVPALERHPARLQLRDSRWLFPDRRAGQHCRLDHLSALLNEIGRGCPSISRSVTLSDMSALLAQLPALIGVIVGALATLLTTRAMDRARWKQTLSIRWDDHRLRAYMDYASAIKEQHALALRIAAAQHPSSTTEPFDWEEVKPLLEQAETNRTKKWEGVLLLGDAATIETAREWRASVTSIGHFADGRSKDWERWESTVRRVDEARDEFYRAARASLSLGGGDVAQAEWLGSKWIPHAALDKTTRAEGNQDMH
ncbi:hypothetical protein [Nonomuraea sp. NPDC050691]|uniref:hypothetical protein n=1 Tax=Nonomuraea sp. NPDC050691 TaxID=3155661 RepID=UPI0033D32F07